MRVLFVHGPAASGKFTVGSRLAERLGMRLFHNHLTVDLATSLFDFGAPGFVELRERVWRTAFELAAREGTSFVFTFQPESTVSSSFPAEVAEAVGELGGRVLFIEIVCPEEVVEERLVADSRRQFGKLRDLDLYRSLRDGGAFDFPPLPAPAARVDSSRLTPDEAVVEIVAQLTSAGALDAAAVEETTLGR